MADSEKTILSQLRKIEKSISSAVKSKKILMGQLKDNLSDKLDGVGDKIDDLNDGGGNQFRNK